MPLQIQKTSTEVINLVDYAGDKLHVTGTTVPTDTTTGYAKGCFFIDTDVVSGTSGLYQNKGTNTSCVFELVPVASTGSVTDLTISAKMITSGTETIAAGGTTTALDLTKTVHNIDADAGGDIFTLANGTAGQHMYIFMKTATGVATITPATKTGFTSVTFDAAGDSVHLMYVTTLGWIIVGGNSYTVV